MRIKMNISKVENESQKYIKEVFKLFFKNPQ